MATQNAPDALEEPLQNAVFFDGFDHVVRASRRESAMTPKQWADRSLIKLDALDQRETDHDGDALGDQSLGYHHEHVLERRILVAERTHLDSCGHQFFKQLRQSCIVRFQFSSDAIAVDVDASQGGIAT